MEVIVFEDCADSVDVFQLCNVEGIGTGFGIVWNGIGPEQIYSVCQMLQLPNEDQSEIVHDVVFMGNVVADSRNKKQAEEAAKRQH